MQLVDKLKIADEMLVAAIDEYLDHKRYIAASNLACVAEEIYGNAIRIEGGIDSQTELANVLHRTTSQPDGTRIPVKHWKKIANLTKNSIKHYDSEADRYIDMEPEEDAKLLIFEAVSNYNKLDRNFSPTVERFHEFCRKQVKANLGIESQ